MKEDTDTVLNALRKQRADIAKNLAYLHSIRHEWPNLVVIWAEQVSDNQKCAARIDAEIARRTKPHKPPGRPKTSNETIAQLRDMLDHGTPKKHAAAKLHIARSTVYRLLAGVP